MKFHVILLLIIARTAVIICSMYRVMIVNKWWIVSFFHSGPTRWKRRLPALVFSRMVFILEVWTTLFKMADFAIKLTDRLRLGRVLGNKIFFGYFVVTAA